MNVILDHLVLNVGDVEKSVEFYRNVLRFSVERLEEFRNGEVPFPSVRVNADTLIDLFPPQMWQTAGASGTRNNLNHFCLALELDDWQALRERLNSGNVEIFKDRTVNFGARGDGISMYFRDPEGNEIEARYYEA
jgi:extradiol dioxygenase family protein